MQKYIAMQLKKGEFIKDTIDKGDGIWQSQVFFQKKTLSYQIKEFTIGLSINKEAPTILLNKRWSRADTRQLQKWTHREMPNILFDTEVQNWIKDGWVVQVVEYAMRGTVERGIFFLPSPNLIKQWDRIIDQENSNNNEVVTRYITEIKELENPYYHSGFETVRNIALDEITTNSIISKRIQFFTALLRTASKDDSFDWKEIGTHALVKENFSAPSKMFDGQREVFCSALNEVLKDGLESIGLTTQPGDYDINLAVAIDIHFSFGCFSYNTCEVISKITAEEVSRLTLIDRKEIELIFATENRAVLRKLVRHLPPEKRKKIAMIGFDGQVRSSVYQFLEHLKNSGIKKLIVWTDFDEAAIYMLEKLKTLNFEESYALILQDGMLNKKTFDEAIHYLLEFKVNHQLIEQELLLSEVLVLEKLLLNEVENDNTNSVSSDG